MLEPLNIVLVASEAVPFSKTGGLGDVTPALARALGELGHRVTLIVPHYPQIARRRGAPIAHDVGLGFDLAMGPKLVPAQVMWSDLPRSSVTVLHIHQPGYFDRAGLYTEDGHDYPDNAERFLFFARAAMEAMRRLILRPDIIHANDWQTGLIPALLKTEYRSQPGFDGAASVFTIHNLLFQGRFDARNMDLTGLPWRYFNWEEMEAWGDLNLLKTGVVFAEKVTTVSPGYAREIQTPEFGNGLDPVLKNRRKDLVGILNGIDPGEWNPAIDPHLEQNYTVRDVREGKTACKAALQREFGLPVRPDVPLLATVSRITDQKGFDLILGAMNKLTDIELQLVVLGTGDAGLERLLRELASQHPDRIAVHIGYDEGMAHRIEAAADIYLMPSAFEPCGLNQMYSMRYGTVPVVRAVGGLADSVVHASKSAMADETATGFSFSKYRVESLVKKIEKAIRAYGNRAAWSQLIRTGMTTDFSWKRSAGEYVELYREAMATVG